MFHRRIIAGALALALAVPAAASAVPAQDPPGASLFAGKAHHVHYATRAAATGDTKNDLPKGNPVPVPASAPAPTAPPADDGTNGWLIAALAEGGVLVALMLAAGLALTRRRAQGLGV